MGVIRRDRRKDVVYYNVAHAIRRDRRASVSGWLTGVVLLLFLGLLLLIAVSRWVRGHVP